MKNFQINLIVIVMFFTTTSLIAQQWNGTLNQTAPISRQGFVGIGQNTGQAPATFLDIRQNAPFVPLLPAPSVPTYLPEIRLTTMTSSVFGAGPYNQENIWEFNGGENLSFRYASSLTGSRTTPLSLNTGGATVNGQLTVNLGSFVVTGSSSLNNRFTVLANGKVVVGNVPTANTSGILPYKLFVEQGILTEKLKVSLKTSANWADYVFAPDYKLKPLSDVEAFVKTNKHLPNVPSADELVKNGGIDVNEMFAKQMEKIEELTLYIIEQNKQMEFLKTRISQLEKH
jgi:hypothetical protein